MKPFLIFGEGGGAGLIWRAMGGKRFVPLHRRFMFTNGEEL